jgi:hypothetical protein
MKIDNIIDEVKSTTNELIIITNTKTIKSLFDDINKETSSSAFGVFKREDGKKVQSVCRGGITVHFVDEKDVDEEVFGKSFCTCTPTGRLETKTVTCCCECDKEVKTYRT